jgi:hypothetical protein
VARRSVDAPRALVRLQAPLLRVSGDHPGRQPPAPAPGTASPHAAAFLTASIRFRSGEGDVKQQAGEVGPQAVTDF